MGSHIPRTAAESFAEAEASRRAASREMENWRAHLARLANAGPEDRDALAFQVRRSERIIAAELANADEKGREANRLESVS